MGTSKNTKTGFTLIEVILFLAITGAILIAILSGTARAIAQQRYNDSVQDLYSFLQSQYSAVLSVENIHGHGQGNDAIYGKIIVFDANARSAASGGSIVNSYTVIGNLAPTNNSNSHMAFNTLDLRAECSEKDPYTSQWGAVIEKITPHSGGNAVTRTIAILRSPTNGAIYTYMSNDEVALITDAVCAGDPTPSLGIDPFGTPGSVFYKIPNDPLTPEQSFNICVYTDDRAYRDKRRNIRISNTNSVNSVRLIPLNETVEGVYNICQD